MAQSRVQKGKVKKSKFPKWLIALVVVLVVVVAGYAIVRFSQASSGHDYKTVENGKLSGGVSTLDKSGYGKYRIVGNTPVTASWAGCSITGVLTGTSCGSEYTSSDNQMCLKVYMDPNSIGNITASVDTPLSPFNTLVKKKITSGTQGEFKTVCLDISVLSGYYSLTSLKAKVTQDQGKVGVNSIWLVRP